MCSHRSTPCFESRNSSIMFAFSYRTNRPHCRKSSTLYSVQGVVFITLLLALQRISFDDSIHESSRILYRPVCHEFDSLLKWPFRGIVKVRIMNPFEYGEDLDLQIKVENGKRVRDGDGVEMCGRVAVGNVSKYISTTKNLQIRVLEVEL